jgi:hypothetical protein
VLRISHHGSVPPRDGLGHPRVEAEPQGAWASGLARGSGPPILSSRRSGATMCSEGATAKPRPPRVWRTTEASPTIVLNAGGWGARVRDSVWAAL